ncbi:response regulator [uncultured Treponema sp.]|uniref:response regulator n=1 Tax=uncultured Treponema sp. TaxID=162155 RepID=UPI0025E9BE4F|nr:response regulator [uncultured Treponema sp.]
MQSNSQSLNGTTRFLANTLHEIRTPIQTIISAAELMQDTKLDKEQTEYIRQILFSSTGLLELANNILDLAKMNQNGFKIENIPFDIFYVCEHVVDSESVKAFNKGVELILDIKAGVPALVTGDSMRVRQIMHNLISNAVKFTNEGFVRIEVDYTKEYGICFTVTDTGIGISEEKQKKLFTEYFQADISTYRLFGGTGLGLSICKNLVSLMNGQIGVKSAPNEGSVFWVKLPLKIAVEKAHKNWAFNSPEKQRILIVDDISLAAQSLKRKLAFLGFSQVEICCESAKVGEIIRQAEEAGFPFAAVFIDMILDGGNDGWHVAFDIVHSEKLKKTPALYLLVPEGQMHEEAKMKVLDLFKAYLYKPIKREPLLELLKEQFSEPEELPPLTVYEKKKFEAQTFDEKKIAEGIKILVAEDHPMNRKLMETFLRRFGADVYIAQNGEEVLEIIKKQSEIRMIFMDIFMPKKDGIETAKELRAMHFNEIIIACTANNDTNDFAEYKRIGINDILLKPFKSETLKTMIEKWKTVMQTMSFEQIKILNKESNFFMKKEEGES